MKASALVLSLRVSVLYVQLCVFSNGPFVNRAHRLQVFDGGEQAAFFHSAEIFLAHDFLADAYTGFGGNVIE